MLIAVKCYEKMLCVLNGNQIKEPGQKSLEVKEKSLSFYNFTVH